MAKHATARLLHPPNTTVAPIPPRSLRRNPAPLPPSTTLYRKPIHPGPRLPPSVTSSFPTLQHGQQIYLYLNLSTFQVLYSLTRHLDNASALKQLPFLAKKTQLPKLHLRKDLWAPFALATFPSPYAGLDAYRKLREFRRLHETNYPLDLIRDPKNPKALLPKKKRGRILMDQKANSVADLAAVLCQLEKGVSQERKERWERVSRRIQRTLKVKKLQKGLGEDGDEERRAKERRRLRLEKVDVVKEMQGCKGVTVQWADLWDAELAAEWPKDVVHSLLGRSRYTAAWPGRNVLAERMEREKKEAERSQVKGEDGEKKEGAPSEDAVKEGLAHRPRKSWREFWFGSKDVTKAARV